MASKPARIYIRYEGDLHYFLWATISKDKSVMIGFPFTNGEDFAFSNSADTYILKEDIYTQSYHGPAKISFHSSGVYKLNCKIGKSVDTVDRATVNGTALANIADREFMAEIIIPKDIPVTSKTPTSKDMVVDIPADIGFPTRCSIFCTRNDIHNTEKSKRFMRDSEWEIPIPMENDTHTWTVVLRASRGDTAANCMYIFFLKEIKWGIDRSPP